MTLSTSIRRWAFNHARLAQSLIVVTTIILFFLGHVLGVLFEALGWDPYAMFLIGAGTGILAWVLAPRKEESFPIRYTYARQKVAVVIMLTSMTVGIGGWAVCLERFDVEPIASVQSQHSEAAIGPKFSKKASANRFEVVLADWFHGGTSKRVLKRTKYLTKKHLNLSSKNVVGLGGVLIFFVALLLAMLVAMFSCSLACNGQTVLAVLVALGGLLLVLTFIDRNLRKIKNKSPKKRRLKAKDPLPDL